MSIIFSLYVVSFRKIIHVEGKCEILPYRFWWQIAVISLHKRAANFHELVYISSRAEILDFDFLAQRNDRSYAHPYTASTTTDLVISGVWLIGTLELLLMRKIINKLVIIVRFIAHLNLTRRDWVGYPFFVTFVRARKVRAYIRAFVIFA